MINPYENQLNTLLTDPTSFSGTPGYKFGFDQMMNATNAKTSRFRGDPNAIDAMMKNANGYATGNYMDYAKMLGGFSNNQNNYNLGQQGADTNQFRAQNDYTLGAQSNANNAQRNWWDYNNAADANANVAARNQNDWNLAKYKMGGGGGNGSTSMGF
jgi:hypothetical protein